MEAMYGIETISQSEPVLSKCSFPESQLTVSVLFIGTTFGEFILSFSKGVLEGLSKEFGGDPDAQEEGLSELINMVAGQTMKYVGDSCEKVTITAPRVIRGNLKLSKVKTGSTTVMTSTGAVHCLFYVDRMRLDIAASYKQVINNLTMANGELANANEKLKMQQSQLVQSEKMASLGMMAAGVAHEINNPLAFVMGNIEVLEGYARAMTGLLSGYESIASLLFEKGQAIEGEKVQELQKLKEQEDIDFILQDTAGLIKQSHQGLHRIKSIVSGLKRFSRMEDESRATMNINEEIENLLVLMQSKLNEKTCSIKKDFLAKKPLKCSPVQIGQVLLNLVANAVDALPSKGGEICISTADTESELIIRVADNGSGIDPDNVSKLFTPFFTTKPIGLGTGLGLAISYGIIKSHEGSIEVESEIGKGTCFTVKIPFAQGEAKSKMVSTQQGG
jgi:signal transduction histidine kinase